MVYENIGYLIVTSVYFLVMLGLLFPIINWIKARYSNITKIIACWFQVSLVMIGYVTFLWLASQDMVKKDFLIVIIGLVIFFIGVFIILDALFAIRTGILIPFDYVVDTGIYSSARHPIYVGTSFMLFGLSVCFWSYYAFFLSILITVLLIILSFVEEKELLLRFGKKYADYMKKVSRFNVLSGFFKSYMSKKVR